jgi:hypothetical protein
VERIQHALAKRKREPWEGVFSTGNPFLLSGFAISKEEGYASTGRLLDMGEVRVQGDRIRLISESPHMKGRVAEYVVVPWDTCVYLVKPSGLLSFCNRVSSGAPLLIALRRVEDFEKAPRGLPAVPAEYREYLLPNPVKTRITSCGPTTHRSAWIVFFPPTHHRTE